MNKKTDHEPSVGKPVGKTQRPASDNLAKHGEIAVSATVILIREKTEQRADQSNLLETLMVQRSATMGFAAGAIVFPGGKVDQGDHDDDLYALLEDSHKAVFNDTRLDALSQNDQHLARVSRFTALRELFEETGVLLAYDQDKRLITNERLRTFSPNMTSLRDLVYNDAGQFLEFFRRENLVPAIDQLTFFSRWQTPPDLHRRFDTWFYLASMPSDQEVVPDGGESTEAIWATPEAFIEMGKTGKKKVIFPTARNLELLNLSSSREAACDAANNRPIVCVQPKVIEREGQKYLIIPDDLGYPITQEALETALRT